MADMICCTCNKWLNDLLDMPSLMIMFKIMKMVIMIVMKMVMMIAMSDMIC